MKVICAIVLAVLGTAQSAEFSELMSVDEMILEADDVVHGHVVHQQFMAAPDGMISTEVQLETMDAFVQSARRFFTFDIPGGEWNGVRLTVPGAPEFKVGDEVIVFVKDGGVLGLSQGALSLKEDRFVQSAMPTIERIDVPLAAIMGERRRVLDCLQEQRQASTDQGWQHRGSLNSGLTSESVRGVAVSLLAGVEYRIGLCSDENGASGRVSIFGPSGDLVATKDHVQGLIDIAVNETGQYLVAVENGMMTDQVWRSRFGLNVSYR